MENLDSYIKKCEAALLELLHEWHPKLIEHFGKSDYTFKEDKTVVTDLDKAFELAIKDVLRPLSSKVGFVGEEYGQEGPADIFWFVDPIDGTELYIRGVDGPRTLLCLIMGGEPVYAFAYRFVKGELFTAQKGKGTKKNGQPIHIKPTELNRVWVETSINFQDPEVVAALVRVAKGVGAVLYTKDFLRVLDGFADAHIVAGLGGPWDYAPRALLMREAGALISNMNSDAYDYKNLTLVAAHPNIFPELKKLLSPQA